MNTDQKNIKIINLQKENKRLQKWVNDLQSGLSVNCVYCGHNYGPSETTPVSMATVLKQHIEQCPQHPMSKLKAKLNEIEIEAKKSLNGMVMGNDFITIQKIVKILEGE